MAYCSESFSIRLFLDYDVHESLPWHITISRTRQLYGEAIFLDLFKLVLKMCVSKGMVRGKRQSVDRTKSGDFAKHCTISRTFYFYGSLRIAVFKIVHKKVNESNFVVLRNGIVYQRGKKRESVSVGSVNEFDS